MANLYQQQAEFAEAAPLYQRALSIREATLGHTHPRVARSQASLSVVNTFLGETQAALHHLLDASQAEWANLTRTFPTLSSQQKRKFLGPRGSQKRQLLCSLVFPKSFKRRGINLNDLFSEKPSPFAEYNPKHSQIGLRIVLLTKQVLLEADRQENSAFLATLATARPEWKARWRKWLTFRRQYGNLALQSMEESWGHPSHQSASSGQRPIDVKVLWENIEQLERYLRKTNSAFETKARLQDVTLEDVRQALRPGQAIVEFVRCPRYDFVTSKAETPYYGAFILVGGKDEVQAVALGDAEENKGIDTMVRKLRRAMEGFLEGPQGPKRVDRPSEKFLRMWENRLERFLLNCGQKFGVLWKRL